MLSEAGEQTPSLVPSPADAAPASLHYSKWQAGSSPADLGAVLFAGELVTFDGLESLDVFCNAARSLIESTLGTSEPQAAEQSMPPEQFRKAAVRARRLVRESEELDNLWCAVLAEIGYPLEEVHRDLMRLRVVPSRQQADSRMIRPLPAHRDTWGPHIAAQINWWLPLYQLSPARTMVLWPEYYDIPLRNTCKQWDYDVLINERPPDYPLLPEALEQPARAGLPVILPAGTLLAFSAGHLHASSRDAGGLARFSMDTRMVWQGDVAAARGAPDVDGGGKAARWDMFERRATVDFKPMG